MEQKPLNYPGWEVVRRLGAGSCGTVYEIKKDSPFGNTEHSALKVISIPSSTEDLQAFYDEMGLDEKSAASLISSHVTDITNEIELMSQLKGNTNIVSYEDYHVAAHENDPGWDIFIRMELLTPLTAFLRGTYPTPEADIDEALVIRLGTDLCRALTVCEMHNILHRDIKPQNIFVNRDGCFKLGDFGIAKTSDHTTSGTRTGTFTYMAPEVYTNQPYNASVDLYSLGLVMYWMLNRRRGPFLPLPPEVPTAADASAALEKRNSGQPLPPPLGGSAALQRIILKAAAYDPAARYATAAEMLGDLEALSSGGRAPAEPVSLSKSSTSVAPASPPPVPAPRPRYEPAKMEQTPAGGGQGKKKSRKLPLLIGAAVLTLVFLLVLLPKGSASPNSSGGSPLKIPLTEEMFLGEKRAENDNFSTYQALQVDGEEREMSLLPYRMEVSPQWEGYMFLTFLDRYQTEYCLYGPYTVSGKTLRLSPCQALDGCEGFPLSQALTYEVTYLGPGITLKRDGSSKELLCGGYLDTGTVTLSGSASSEGDVWQDIQSMDIVCRMVDGGPVSERCDILFSDGGYAMDTSVTNLYDSIGSIYFTWNRALRQYNGRMEVDETHGNVNFKYLNNWPYGFTILDSTNGKAYFYQSAPLSLPEE